MADAPAVAPFVHRHRVRYRDCDPQRRVFSANYLAFLDDAVTELWRERAGGYESLTGTGVDFVVAEARITYSRPAVADDLLDIELAIGELGETSMLIEFLMTRAGRRVARGELHYVFIDVVSERRAAVPPAVHGVLETLVAP